MPLWILKVCNFTLKGVNQRNPGPTLALALPLPNPLCLLESQDSSALCSGLPERAELCLAVIQNSLQIECWTAGLLLHLISEQRYSQYFCLCLSSPLRGDARNSFLETQLSACPAETSSLLLYPWGLQWGCSALQTRHIQTLFHNAWTDDSYRQGWKNIYSDLIQAL